MQISADLLYQLLPWEFSPTWALACMAAGGLYLLGGHRLRAQGRAVASWRSIAYLAGVAATYAVTQTQLDYLSRFMFFAHRGQHLVLHHLAPFLICLAAPWPVLAAGLPRWVREKVLVPLARNRLSRTLYASLQNALVAPLLFVGLIYLWLVPAIHFDAMLSLRLYEVMNWSMFLDGLLFWWLILDPDAGDRRLTRPGYGVRMILVLAVVPPQIVLGAYIALSRSLRYDVYDVCGRAWPIDPMTDQQIGGLLTWIPPAMMSLIGALVLLRYLLGGARGKRSVA